MLTLKHNLGDLIFIDTDLLLKITKIEGQQVQIDIETSSEIIEAQRQKVYAQAKKMVTVAKDFS